MSTGYLSGLVICFVCIITFIPYNTALTTKPVRCPSGGSHSTVPKRSPRLSPTRLLLARSPHSAAEPVSDTRMPPLLLGFFLSLSVYNYSATGLTSVEREAQRSQTRPPVSTARSHRTGCPPRSGTVVSEAPTLLPRVSRLSSAAAATLSQLAAGSRGTQCLNRRGSDPGPVTS